MRKIKKINGFLVVKFNDREKREYEGTALGEYGVIDAEVYTGNLDIDRGAMEYDDADTLEVAVELARGLESEEDITDEPPTYTAAVETNESYTEEAVEPTALIEGWTRRLATQVKSKHYPDTDPRTAAHELYGFKMALHQIGFLPESEVITDPDTFGAGRLDGPMPRNPEELLAFVCDERCKNRAGHTQEELDAICAKCPLGQLYEDAEAQDLRIRERSERALREHIEGVRHAEDTLTALLGGHEALAYLAALRDGQILQENECEHYAAQIAEAGAAWETVLEGVSFEDLSRLRHLLREVDEYTKGGGELVSRLGVRRRADLLIPPEVDVFEAVRAASAGEQPLACVLCDESQFFTPAQAEQLFMVTVDLNIPVICYGLRSDFSLKGFPGSTRLLELAHTIEEMKTICTCGRKATCNCRRVNGEFVFEGEQVAIDLENDVQYVSMCPQCYFKARRAFYAKRNAQ